MKEIWVDIKDYEGLYMVSNYGRVKSLNYRNTGIEKILKAGKEKKGHMHVVIYKNGIKKQLNVHVLVAEAFLPNPYNKPIVHHIDENPDNNRVDNLMWVTEEQHRDLHCSKPINQFDLEGNFIRRWKSSHEIERKLGIDQGVVLKCCKGWFYRKGKLVNRKQAYGYIWKYAEDC